VVTFTNSPLVTHVNQETYKQTDQPVWAILTAATSISLMKK